MLPVLPEQPRLKDDVGRERIEAGDRPMLPNWRRNFKRRRCLVPGAKAREIPVAWGGMPLLLPQRAPALQEKVAMPPQSIGRFLKIHATLPAVE